MKKKIAVSLNLDELLMRYTLIYRGIQEYAEEHTDWSIHWDHFPESKLKDSKSKEDSYHGVIGRIKEETHVEAQRLNIPCVNLWHNSKLQKKIPSCLFDFYQSGRMVAEHLLSRGFKELTNIDVEGEAGRLFLEGLRSVADPLGYKVNVLYFDRLYAYSIEAWEKQRDIFEQWVEGWSFPMAIASSFPLVGVPTFCKSMGLKIPEDVAIVLASSETGICETIKPYITTADTNCVKVGYEAARLLHQMLENEELEKTHVYIKPKSIIPRKSTDIYATDDAMVKKALRFIAANIDKEIQVLDVVYQVSISKSALEKRFKAATGTTIKEEINRLRLVHAQRLMLNRSLRINQIHKQSGFSSAQHMCRVFKKSLGMTPGEYRDSLKE